MTNHDPLHHGLPNVGDLLAGKYRIEKLLGMGGMGAVYGANHEILGQKVAIKVLLAEIASNQEAVARFLNEARAAAKIQNSHCARVMDVGTLEHNQAYMVMEYLEGCDLGQLLERQGPLPLQSAVDYVLQSLEALAHAHALHLVHRDLKPANLFLARQQDGTDIVKVLDFGISKATDTMGGTNPSLTSTKALLGSPLYMSPEQLRSSKSVDPRTDIWALGIILFELLTGRTPYDGDNVGELFAAILEKDAPSLLTFRPDAPPGLDQAVLACLRRDPNQRFQNVGQLADALAPFASPFGAMSAEHVRRSLATLTGTAAPIPLGDPRASSAGRGNSGGVPGGQTAAAWGDAGLPPKSGGAGKVVGVVVVMLAIAAGVGFVALKGTHGSSTTAAASPGASASGGAPATSASAAPSASAASTEPAPSASAPPSAASGDVPSSATPTPTPGTAATPGAATPAVTAPGTAPGTPGATPPVATRPSPGAAGGTKSGPAAQPQKGAPTAAPTVYDPTKDRSAQ